MPYNTVYFIDMAFEILALVPIFLPTPLLQGPIAF